MIYLTFLSFPPSNLFTTLLLKSTLRRNLKRRDKKDKFSSKLMKVPKDVRSF
mgnify:CR=1 FL=1